MDSTADDLVALLGEHALSWSRVARTAQVVETRPGGVRLVFPGSVGVRRVIADVVAAAQQVDERVRWSVSESGPGMVVVDVTGQDEEQVDRIRRGLGRPAGASPGR